MWSRLRVAALLLFCMVPEGYAQNLHFGLNFLLGQPKEEFQENVDNLGFGLGGMSPIARPTVL